ncbi:MAG: hypothetical protein H6978_00415 [Gammaproteobacteria bacterium]|nr:hypothetical protein [Gammaproteobacteria bacterium]
MGLDSVELVLAIEEFFDIEIPDDIASEMRTPGDIYDYLIVAIEKKRFAKTPRVASEVIWTQLVGIIVNQLGVEPDLVTKHTDFVRDLRIDQ